jgi:hypothetical protein
MPDGRRFKNIDEFKEVLLKDRDQLARALTEKLMSYATGAAIGSIEQAEIEAVVSRTRTRNCGLRSLVQEIVQSKAFQTK